MRELPDNLKNLVKLGKEAKQTLKEFSEIINKNIK